jgi:exosortase/archaeosortase family protein
MYKILKSPLVRFIGILALFLVIGAGLRAIYHYVPSVAYFVQHSWAIDTFYRIIIFPASYLLSLSGVPHEVAYTAAQAQYFLKITETNYWLFLWIPCLGISLMYVYAALVVAFPGSWRRKLVFVIGGWISIQILNILRFYGVAMLLANDTSGNNYLAKNSWVVVNHEDVFNYFVIFLIFMMFVGFARRLGKADGGLADGGRADGGRRTADSGR